MRFFLTTCMLSFSCLHSVYGLNNARNHHFRLMADMGLLPDGTPMELSNYARKVLKAALSNSPPPNETIHEEYVELPLDHFPKYGDKSAGTFFNRFWVSESAYQPGGPVFLYDVGEANAQSNALFRLQNDTSFFKQIVDQYHGIGVVWEHRYYGNSTPEPINLNTSPETFQWLTTEQSLADVDTFAKQFKRKNINHTLTPDQTPWIFVGGSYPAMRAAFMRKRYPDTIFASYASSAPVEARVDMSVYFEPVWNGLNTYGYGNCTKDIHAAINHIDKILSDPTASANLKKQFLGLGAENNSAANFADSLVSVFNLWQSYGVDGGSYSLRYFCDYLSTDPSANKTAGADGWASTKGANFTVARWSSYPRWKNMVNDYFNTACSGSQTVRSTNCDLGQRIEDPSNISWLWQYCTQWGFFQSANLGDHQLVSKYNSLEHQRDVCHRQFPTAKSDVLPEWPNVQRTNRVFGGWDIRPSNVYWSGGQFDPWRTLSPLSDLAQIDAPEPSAFTTAPKCGEGQDEESIFGYVMAGAQHCYDFRTTFAGGSVSRDYFTQALTEWLKCFKPKGKAGGYGHRFNR